jgi:sphingomyelin phosphodiesterase 2
MRKVVMLLGAMLTLFLISPVLLVLVMAPFNQRTGAPTVYQRSGLLADPPAQWTAPVTLRIVTFNIADAYGFTTNRPERMRAIAATLTRLDPDLVGLQESFIARDRALLLDALGHSRLTHHVRFPAGTTGNGLLILSAYPIKEHWFYRYYANNPWYRLWEGDWWAGKGVGLARVELPGGFLDFYDTHAQAGRSNPTHYVEVRTKQMAGLAQFMNGSRTGSAPAFIVGDFNTPMDRSDLATAIEEAHLLRMMNQDTGIDHIFAVDDPHYRFEVLDTVPITGKVMGSRADIFLSRAPTPRELKGILFGPGEETSLSDHRGWMSTVRITPVADETGE